MTSELKYVFAFINTYFYFAFYKYVIFNLMLQICFEKN